MTETKTIKGTESLPELLIKTAELEAKVIESGGEISEFIENELATIESMTVHKTEAYHAVQTRMQATSDWLQSKIDELKKSQAAIESARDIIRERIKFLMQNFQVSELKGETIRYVLTRGANAVDVVDETQIPKNYIKTVVKTVESIDKKKILSDIESGAAVPGCQIREVYTLKTYGVKP